MHRRHRAEPLRPRALDLRGKLQQQVLAGEIAVELHADRQTVAIQARGDVDAGQAGLVARHGVAAGIGQPVHPRLQRLVAQQRVRPVGLRHADRQGRRQQRVVALHQRAELTGDGVVAVHHAEDVELVVAFGRLVVPPGHRVQQLRQVAGRDALVRRHQGEQRAAADPLRDVGRHIVVPVADRIVVQFLDRVAERFQQPRHLAHARGDLRDRCRCRGPSARWTGRSSACPARARSHRDRSRRARPS